jgi:hypothetical protein
MITTRRVFKKFFYLTLLSIFSLFFLYLKPFSSFAQTLPPPESVQKPEEVTEKELGWLCNYFQSLELPQFPYRENKCPKNTNGYCYLYEDVLEMPLGKSADYAEYMAERISWFAGLLAQAARREAMVAQGVYGYIDECKEGLCRKRCNYTNTCPSTLNECTVVVGGVTSWTAPNCGVCQEEGGCCVGETEVEGKILTTCCGKIVTCTNCTCIGIYQSGGVCDAVHGACRSFKMSIAGNIVGPEQSAQYEGMVHLPGLHVNKYYGLINDFFKARFWPAWLYQEQYGTTTISINTDNPNNVFYYINQGPISTCMINLASQASAGPELYNQTDLDAKARDLCNPPPEDCPGPPPEYCIKPVEFFISRPKDNFGHPIPITLTNGYQLFGYLDKAQIRMSQCTMRPFQQLKSLLGYIEATYILNCGNILQEGIEIRSFPDAVLNNQTPGYEGPGIPVIGCYGKNYCLYKSSRGQSPRFRSRENMPTASEPEMCLDDFYCCYR